MKKKSVIFNREVISWSLYDFANTIYSMNILSLYFKRWVVEDLGHDGLYYDVAFSASMLLSGLIMPALGAVSDYSGKKKIFLFLFTFSCCLALGLIPAIPSTFILAVIVVFGLSNFFYEGGLVFYNALLYSISEGVNARLVSGVGVALGYLGSIVGMIMVLPFVSGDIFGFSILPGGGGKEAAFLPTAALFMLFSIPLFIWVRERHHALDMPKAGIKRAYRDVWNSVRNTKKYPGVLRFLIADYFFEDTVATVILNIGIFSSLVLGFSDADLTLFLTISTVSAMLGSFIIGRLAQNLNLKRLMAAIIWGWIIALLCIITFENRVIIYVVASFIGVLLGGLWTVSRPLLAEMVPRSELGRFFGLYSLSGRAAAVFGPVLWGLIIYFFSPQSGANSLISEFLGLSGESSDKLPYRIAVISLILILATGLFIFRKVPFQGNREKGGS